MAQCVCPNCGHEFEPAARKPRAVKAVVNEADLSRSIKIVRKGRTVGSMTCRWADGAETRQSAVVWSNPADKWAAGFQACDRLRRARASRKWSRPAGSYARGACGVKIDSADWRLFVRTAPMPQLLWITDDASGESYAPDGREFGGGDLECAALAWGRMERDDSFERAERSAATWARVFLACYAEQWRAFHPLATFLEDETEKTAAKTRRGWNEAAAIAASNALREVNMGRFWQLGGQADAPDFEPIPFARNEAIAPNERREEGPATYYRDLKTVRACAEARAAVELYV